MQPAVAALLQSTCKEVETSFPKVENKRLIHEIKTYYIPSIQIKDLGRREWNGNPETLRCNNVNITFTLFLLTNWIVKFVCVLKIFFSTISVHTILQKTHIEMNYLNIILFFASTTSLGSSFEEFTAIFRFPCCVILLTDTSIERLTILTTKSMGLGIDCRQGLCDEYIFGLGIYRGYLNNLKFILC